MTARKTIRIDEERCDGCGLCVPACHEGALAIVDGKARLVSASACDGLGSCLGECPRGAITIVAAEGADREGAAPEAGATAAQPLSVEDEPPPPPTHHGHACPGSALRVIAAQRPQPAAPAAEATADQPPPSSLGHWPVQLTLVPPHAPFLAGADLVVCADCVPFAVPDFHARYLGGRAILVGCPKLDDLGAYHQKLIRIIAEARPTRITVVRMEVPCCGGIAQAVLDAAARSAPGLRVEVHTVGIRGGISTSATVQSTTGE
jgi:ferredoxin